MKRILFLLVFTTILSCEAYSQNKNQAVLLVSYNQIELAHHRSFFQQKIWSEVYFGVGNQDINSNYDDFLTGLRIGLVVYTHDKNEFNIIANVGAYFPNNDLYSVATSVFGGDLRYSRYIGKMKKHRLLFNAGYRYGMRNYIQEYLSDEVKVVTTGEFRIPPLHLSIGYAFHF